MRPRWHILVAAQTRKKFGVFVRLVLAAARGSGQNVFGPERSLRNAKEDIDSNRGA